MIAHSDMAPGRKADPGPKFDWRRLARGGRAVWAEAAAGPGAADWAAFRAAAEAAGYGAPAGDWEAVLAAVRLRFRPWAAGALDAADIAAERCGMRALDSRCVDAGRAPAPRESARGWPDGRGRTARGKSGLQGEMAAGNARPGQPEGKRHRDETARRLRPAGKGETVG